MPSPFDDIFGGAGPQWSREQIIARIRGEADAQKVDPDLAVAVATQESSLKPDNHGDNGKSRGLFHLQERAAIDAGINPKWRDDPGVNIYGGVRYLKQKLDQSGGNVEQALSRYNRGTPDYRGIGDPNYVNHVLRHYNPSGALAKQQPTLLQRAAAFVQPASAEAATPQQAQATSSPVWDDIFGAQQAAPQAPPQAPAPPTATSTPEQDAAYRTSRDTQPTPPVSQTAPAQAIPPRPQEAPGAPNTSATPGMRFQALPSIQQLPPEERIRYQQEFEALSPELQQEFLASETPADLPQAMQQPRAPQVRAAGAVPATQAPRTEAERQARVQEELRQWEQQAGRPWREGDPRMPSEKKLGAPDEAPVTESITAPSTMIPLLMPGAGLKLAAGPIKTAAPLVSRAVRAGAEGLSQTLGWGTGRTIETGQVPSPTELGTEAALNVAAGGILEGLGAAGQAILRRSQAGKAIVAADEATTGARQEFEQATALAKAEQQAGRAEAYQAAERRAREAQVRYQTKVQARDQTIAANEQTYQEALTAQRAEVQAEQSRRYGQARTETMEETAAAQAKQQQYGQAVAGQEQAITQARAVPGRYTPETPSWVQYEKFGDAAKDAVVDLTPAKAALAEVRASRGVLPDGTLRPFPAAVESIATSLEKATGETSFKTIREELRRLGPLTRHGDGHIRGPAKQLYGIYADVLEASPVANDLLRNANATFRREMAVQDIADWLKPGGGIVGKDLYNRETINVKKLFEKLDSTIANDSLFRGSFTPDELRTLQTDIGKVAGTRPMPGRDTPPPGATPELLPGAAPNIPASMQPPTPKALPPEVPRPRVEMLPGGAGPGRRGPALPQEPQPTTPRQALGERPKVFEGLTRTAMQDYMGSLFGIPPGLVMGSKALWRLGAQGRYGMARALLNVEARPGVMQALREFRGQVGQPLYGTMVNVLSDAERKALLRDTRETREKRR